MAWNKPDDWKAALEPIGMLDFFKESAIPDDITGVMSNGNWEVIFHQYATAEFASENVEFLRGVRAFEISGDLNQAAEIYREFVAESSPRQVNLKATARVPLDEIFGPDGEGIGPPNLFDTARDEITKMIGADTFPRFLSSATSAQKELFEPIDWDNVEGRDHAGAVSEAETPPAPAAPAKKSLFAKKDAQ